MFTIQRKEIQNALRIIGKFAARRTHIPVLQCALVETFDDGLILSGTDLEIGATIGVPATSGQPQQARLVLNIGHLNAAMFAIQEDEVAVNVEQNVLVIGRTRLRASLSADDFPEVPKMPEIPLAEYEPGPSFADAMRFCAPAVSAEATRYALTGVYLDFPRGALVASDGKRLHFARMGEPAAVPPVIVQPRVFAAVSPDRLVLPWTEKEGETPGQVFLAFAGGHAYSRTVEGQFPEYDQVVPAKCSSCFTAARAELLEGLHSLLPLVSKRQPCCTISANGRLDLLAKDEDTGAESAVQVEGTLTGRAVTVRVNPHLLWDLLEGIPGTTLRVCFQGTDGAMLIEDPESTWFGLVMPIRQ